MALSRPPESHSILTWNLEALLIVENVDHTLVALDCDRRWSKLGSLVAQLNVVGQSIFEEDLTRSMRGTERIQGVNAVVSVPAWERPHQ